MMTLTKIIHIAVASAWFGHKLSIPTDLRSSLGDADAARRLLPRLARAEALGVPPGWGRS